SLMLVHGTRDENIPWSGLNMELGNGQTVPLITPVPESFAFWAQRAGCTSDVQRSEVPPRNPTAPTRVELLRVGDCDAGGEVVLVAVVGGGHNWPGSNRLSP